MLMTYGHKLPRSVCKKTVYMFYLHLMRIMVNSCKAIISVLAFESSETAVEVIVKSYNPVKKLGRGMFKEIASG